MKETVSKAGDDLIVNFITFIIMIPFFKDHHYTIDTHERDVLSTKHGWIYEGIGWYSDDAKTVPIYRRFYPFITSGSHHYTKSLNEAKHLLKVGWVDEGIGWYGVAEK